MQIQESAPTILQKIVQDKAKWVAAKEAAFPLAEFEAKIVPSDRDFYQALQTQAQTGAPAYILECKKASPSKGLIRADFDLDAIAQVYKHYATAISVLTDEAYFQGDFAFVTQVRNQVAQPVLCKDFMISPYQVYLARYYQADAILLMLSVLDDETYVALRDLAHSLKMGVLTETSNEAEFERALKLGAKIIGVNNRDLHTLTVDLTRTERLVTKYRAELPEEAVLISESGIYTHQDVTRISPFAQGFLIGSSLMGSADLNSAVRSVIFGKNKVCGLTRLEDALVAYQAGANYLGLIFAEKSPRRVSLETAAALVADFRVTTRVSGNFVGVFQNQSVETIAHIAAALGLHAVQLHGDEDADFILALREKLAPQIAIWRALSVALDSAQTASLQTAFEALLDAVARVVLDSKTANAQGGTGQAFDWSLIPAEIKQKALLAGGIDLQNLNAALTVGCLGVDLNSGLEAEKGKKDPTKIATAFALIRRYPNAA